MRTTIFAFAATLVLTLALPAAATDYYVSPNMGSDLFDGLRAAVNGSTGPFASVKPLQALTLRHGDRVLFRCGDRFTGPLNLTLNNQDAGELTLGSYGDCTAKNKPTIDGRVPVTTPPTGQLQHFSEAARIAQVFSGDAPLPRARFPAVGYLIVPERAAPSQATLSPFAALIGHPLQGAQLHARTEEWFIEERMVTGEDGQLDAALQYPLRPKNGFYLSGKAWMIGDKDAWSYDANARQLSVRAPPGAALSKVPSGHLFQISGKGSLTVAGIDFDAAGGDAIHSRLDGIVTIKDVGIRRAEGNGITIAGARNAFVVNSTISDVGLDAIFFAETKRVFIRRNRITNAGLYAGPRPSLAAINAHRTESATIEENMVEKSAYIGIRFSGDARIRNNYVAQSCLLLSDCAALYTWRRNPQDKRPHSEVIGNLIDGAKGDTTVKLGVNDYFAGIYLDEFSNNVLVANNIMVDVNQGIYLHNAYDNEVRNNIVRARSTSLIDSLDKIKYPTLANAMNKVLANSEKIGGFVLSLVDDSGAKVNFSFEHALKVELSPSLARGTSAPAGRKCAQDTTLQPPQQDKPRGAFVAAANCD